MVIPLVQHLIRQQLADPVVVALTIAGAACKRAGIESLGFRDFLPDDSAEILRLGEELTLGMIEHPEIDHAESVAYHGMSYFDLVQRHGADAAAELYRQRGRAGFFPLSVFEDVIRDVSPDLVVATNSPRSERAAIEAASTLGVPSVCVLDAFGLQEEWIQNDGFANRVCVLSEPIRQMVGERGRPMDEIIVTGNPAFDALTEVQVSRAGSLRSTDELRILWASHPDPPFHPLDETKRGNSALSGQIAAELVRCAERHPEWTVVVRPHPSESDFSVDGPANLSVIGSEALEGRLAWADVVVTAASTVGLQAALAGIPVVAVAGSVIGPDVPLADFGLAHGVEVDELSALLERLHENPEALDHGLPELGGATQRVVDVLMSLC